MQRLAWVLLGSVLGAFVAFLLLERPWLRPEEKVEGPGTPLSTYFMGGEP